MRMDPVSMNIFRDAEISSQRYDAFSVGEMPCVYDPNEIIKAVGFDRNVLNMIVQFEIVNLDHCSTRASSAVMFTHRNWVLTELKAIADKWQSFMKTNDGWNAIYLENYDQAKSVSRFVSDDQACARGGGGGSGSRSIAISNHLVLRTGCHWGIKKFLTVFLLKLQKKARDNARTPMQWDASENAGFSTVTPFLTQLLYFLPPISTILFTVPESLPQVFNLRLIQRYDVVLVFSLLPLFDVQEGDKRVSNAFIVLLP
ncbi:hypothetical protein V1506DRAFT_495890 [Lipomyces tetrasporus]